MVHRHDQVDRRTACAAALGWLALPRGAFAQPARRAARVAFLVEGPIDEAIERDALAPFRRGLKELGYVEGANLVVSARSADGRNEALDERAAELLRLAPDVLLAAFPAAAFA